MKRSLIAGVLLTSGIGIGYVAGQVSGVLPGYAASQQTTAAQATRPFAAIAHALPFAAGQDGAHDGGNRVFGKVTAVNGNTISVTAQGDPRSTTAGKVTTITLSSSTQVSSGHDGTATRADIKAGVYVSADGTLSTDGTTLAASEIDVLPAGFTPGADGPGRDGGNTPHADGTVTAVNGNTITVKADSDPAGSTEYTKVTTIVLTGSTTYGAGHDGTATKGSIVTGSYIVAEGTLSADGTTLTATQVGIRSGKTAEAHSGGAFH